MKLMESPRTAYRNLIGIREGGPTEWVGGVAKNRAAGMHGQMEVYSESGEWGKLGFMSGSSHRAD